MSHGRFDTDWNNVRDAVSNATGPVGFNDQDITKVDDIVLKGTTGPVHGLRLGETGPSFGWGDITADIVVKGGANTPTWATFLTNISAYQFDIVGDEVWQVFHIPHDYVPGSEIKIHAHWGLNGAGPFTTGSITWGFDATFAPRNDTTPIAFQATVNKTIQHDFTAVNVAQYAHVVSEVQLTNGSGQLAMTTPRDIEVDGLVLVRSYLSADTGGVEPFLFTVDLHYQTTGVIGTKTSSPPYYI